MNIPYIDYSRSVFLIFGSFEFLETLRLYFFHFRKFL